MMKLLQQTEALTRYFALTMGILFVLAGVGGFLPFITQPPPSDAMPLHVMTSYGLLLGLFPINIIHNVFHFTLGVLGLLAYRQFSAARTYARVVSVILGVLTVMGLIPSLNTLFGWVPLYGHDIWLHGLEAIVGAYLGFFVGRNPRLAITENRSME